MVVTTIPGLDIAYPPRDWAPQLAALGYRFIGRYCPYFGDQEAMKRIRERVFARTKEIPAVFA